MEVARFFVVAMAGLALDLALAWSAAALLGLPLWLAAVLGFTVAAGANYAAHELWTFRTGLRRLSAGRALRYGVALTATLGARVAAVAALAARAPETPALAILGAGAGVSFCVNYLVSKHLVFRTAVDPKEDAFTETWP